MKRLNDYKKHDPRAPKWASELMDSLKKGKNWISNIMIYGSIKGKTTIEKSVIAQEMYAKGESVKSIAKHMGLSKSRIYEYLK